LKEKMLISAHIFRGFSSWYLGQGCFRPVAQQYIMAEVHGKKGVYLMATRKQRESCQEQKIPVKGMTPVT
jgi:hypothetical protein